MNTHFKGRVELYDKKSLLQGAGFSPDTIQGQLSLILLSFDSLRARNKEDRKIFQENGYLASFDLGNAGLLESADPTALINVIRALKPVVIVDESHNAESDLSVEMLKNLNPSFILDLTATPRNNSNIVSFVDALALKKESMVKLPVIVYNRPDKTEVVNNALQLQVAHQEPLLNMSYVFTASNKFMDTLDKVVKGLNRAGFSDRDYRAFVETDIVEVTKPPVHPDLFTLPPVQPAEYPSQEEEIDVERIQDCISGTVQAEAYTTETADTKDALLDQLTARANETNQEFTEKAKDADSILSPDMESRRHRMPIKERDLGSPKRFKQSL